MDSPAPSRRSIVIASVVIFAVAVTLRVPSCYESFWVDELHSAWCVWDSMGEVFPRAAVGHQTPFYFVGLWIWKQIVGTSEVALRLSSVLAVAVSCVVLTAGVTRWTRSLAAGSASGMVMALESNSLFFGTELRPYAFVILLASVALACFFPLVMLRSRREHRTCWTTFMIAMLMAALAQPTSMGVLLWLPAALFLIWLNRDRGELCKFSVTDGLIGLAVAATVFTLWNTALGEAWKRRGIWATFASARRVDQIWEAWDWTWLWIVPMAFVLAAAIVAKLRNRSAPSARILLTTALLSLIAILATISYWIVARMEWAPIWHRRYFIAVLPILACVAGGAVGSVQAAVASSRRGSVAGWLLAATVLCWPGHVRRTMVRLRDYPIALVARGEDWRGAVAWTRQDAGPNDLILLDAGLIESAVWPADPAPASQSGINQLTYLTYPVRGPYSLDRKVVPIGGRSLNFPTNHPQRRVYFILRRPASQIQVTFPYGSQIRSFGNVTVVRQSSRLDRSF